MNQAGLDSTYKKLKTHYVIVISLKSRTFLGLKMDYRKIF